MFKEILKIIPSLENQDLNNMERKLQGRFTKIAKKFGKGLVGALAGGGIAGIALGFLDKILNPLKEVQEAIDKTLKQGDDIVTNAKQFNTSSGKLFKLQQLAASTGLDGDSLFMLMNKFQTSVAEAQAKPNEPSAVKNFVGTKDTADAFFEFIQSLQKMDRNQQLLVQSEVFGEKQILKMADFLQTDFAKQTKLIGAKGAETYTPGLEKLGNLNDLKDALAAKTTLEDTMAKSRLINESMVRGQAEREKLELQKENQRISAYETLNTLSTTVTKISSAAESLVVMVGKAVDKLTGLTTMLQKFSTAPIFRGIKSLFGGDEK
jgi:hypothetical protein